MAEDFDDLIALLRRTTDNFGWLQPLLDDPDSAALLGADVSIFARTWKAAIHDRDAATISASSAGQAGTSVLTMRRGDGSTSGLIPTGYRFLDDRGVQAISQLPLPVAVGQLVLIVAVKTLRETELVNTVDEPAFAVHPQAAPVPAIGGVSNLIAPDGAAGNTASTFVAVETATPISGGAADYLSVHGSERGILRQPNEREDDYRQRVRNVPDKVSPIAVGDLVSAASQVPGVPPFLVLEPFDDGASADLKALHGLGGFDLLATDTDFLDELVTPELGDRRDVRAYFRLQAQEYVQDSDSEALFLDDGFSDDPAHGYMDAFLVYPPRVMAALLALVQSVAATKAGGVLFDAYMRSADAFYGVGAAAPAFPTNVWAISPPSGTAWLMVEASAGHDSPNPVPGAQHKLIFAFLGGDVYDTGWYTGTDTQRIPVVGRVVTQIVGMVQSDGTTPVNLVGAFLAHSLVGFTG